MPISIPCCRVSASCKIAERNARPDLGNRRPRRKSDGDIRRQNPTPPSPELTGNWRVDWLDASRNVQPLIAALGVYTVPRLSPDGKNLANILYGVLKGTITGHLRDADDDHYQVLVSAKGTMFRIAVNVHSNQSPPDLLFQTLMALPASMTQQMTQVPVGF